MRLHDGLFCTQPFVCVHGSCNSRPSRSRRNRTTSVPRYRRQSLKQHRPRDSLGQPAAIQLSANSPVPSAYDNTFRYTLLPGCIRRQVRYALRQALGRNSASLFNARVVSRFSARCVWRNGYALKVLAQIRTSYVLVTDSVHIGAHRAILRPMEAPLLSTSHETGARTGPEGRFTSGPSQVHRLKRLSSQCASALGEEGSARAM